MAGRMHSVFRLLGRPQPVCRCLASGSKVTGSKVATPGVSWVSQPRRSAGHSHWQNIRHIKGANDAKKQQSIIKIKQKIKIALKAGNSSNPELNRDLQRCLDEAKSSNIPASTITEFIKKITESPDAGSMMVAEAKGVGNCLLMIECYTDRQIHTRKQLTAILRRTGGQLLEGGRAASMFDHKGAVYAVVTTDAAEEYTVDAATEHAIEVGAEEVTAGVTDSGADAIKFVCAVTDLHQVKSALESLGVTVEDARLEYLPHTLTTLTAAQLDTARSMITDLTEDEHVVRVYHNIADGS